MSQFPKILRPPQKNDINFIFNSWLKSFIDSPDNPIKGNAYYSYQHLLINSILSRAEVSILCNPDDLEQIFGFIVYEMINNIVVVHWLHVKYSFRQLGFARYIITAILNLAESRGIFNPVITITHRGLSYKHLKDKFKHIYNPKLAFKFEELK
jgi:ribosomal protein S18 acetylase RimI-like enzyme